MVGSRGIVHVFLLNHLHQVLPRVHVHLHYLPNDSQVYLVNWLLILDVLLFDLLFELFKLTLLLLFFDSRFLHLLISFLIITAQFCVFKAPLEGVFRTQALNAPLLLVICEIIVYSIVQISVIVLLILPVYVFALVGKSYDSLLDDHVFYFFWPVVEALFLLFLKVADG